MTTWTTIRHPWFDEPSMKRKLSVNTTSSPPRSPRSSPPPKRRKCSVLESDFSQLTINNNPLDSTDTASHASTSAAWPCISEFMQAPGAKVQAHEIILPGYVEEPSVPEVKMKSSSWYEPEPDRIVVTDLDSSSDEDEGGKIDAPPISISRTLLKRLSSHAKYMEPQIPLPISSQALVLYQPLQRDSSTDDPKSNEGMICTTMGEVIGEDNSMDVEL